MQDVFNRLLVTSDPYISSVRKLPQKPLKSFAAEAVQLLEPPEIPANTPHNYYSDDAESSTETSLSLYESDNEQDFCY